MSAPAAAKPKASKPKAPRKAPAHPKYSVMVAEAITELKERTGSSRQAIAKYIENKYHVGEAGKRQINAALKKGVVAGTLVTPKGHGGSYRLAKKEKEAKPKKPKAVKKPAAKKATKKTGEKKTAKPKTAKKPAPKKAPKSPKAKKPAAKKPAAKKSPKKSTKKAAKPASA